MTLRIALAVNRFVCRVSGHHMSVATVLSETYGFGGERHSVSFLDESFTKSFVFERIPVPSDQCEDALMEGSVKAPPSIAHYAGCSRCGYVNWRS